MRIIVAVSCSDHFGPSGIGRGTKQYRTADCVDYVRPWIGSNTGRWFQTVSGCRPFGMIGITPDTEFGGRGYVYDKTDVYGFSHLHGWGLGAIMVMPTTSGVSPAGGPDGWKSAHQHTNEIMTAGYHKLVLDRYNITAEITSTARAGFHRWTFGSDGVADIFFDLHSVLGGTDQTDAQAAKVGDREIEGWVHMNASGGSGYEGESRDVGKVYFVARFNKPFASLRAWKKADLGAVNSAAGHPLVVYPRFQVKRGDVLLMKIGISFCNTSQARKNLDVEIGERDFQSIKDEARAEWNEWLGKVRVTGGSEQQRIKFYTDVWHTLLGRQTLNDVDGRYFDRMNNRIRQIPLVNGKPRHRVFNSDAFWWTMWNLNIWWGSAYPSVLEEWVQDSLLWYDNDPEHRIPWGNVNGAHSWIMLGAERTPLICRAAQMGMTGFDVEKAYAALRQMHMSSRVGGNGWLDGLDDYLKLGYIPYDAKIHDQSRTASLTCDDAYTDSGAGPACPATWKNGRLHHVHAAVGELEELVGRPRIFVPAIATGGGPTSIP